MATSLEAPISPTAHMHFDLGEMITITHRLSDLLSEESRLLSTMKVKEIAPLQEEKKKLSKQLESFQRILAADDSPVRNLHVDRKEELLVMSEGLYEKIEEAMYRTAIAQSVNQRVMQVFVDAMADQQRLSVYGNQGQANAARIPPLSVNLNEKA
jgi:flagellar biosynthesis/type III secretory pathway chaperone